MTDEEFREKWIAALRSGEYKQGSGTLRDEKDRYCCIGVACDIHPDIRWGSSVTLHPAAKSENDRWNAVYDCETHEQWALGSLYRDGCELIGITPEAQALLIDLNDDQYYDFEEIAKVLEAGVYDLLKDRAVVV